MALNSALALLPLVQSLDNGVGLFPPLGYNTWNDLGCSRMSESAVKAAAEELERSGLKDLGYRYVNLDDCWQDPAGRDPGSGTLRADPERFPSGIASLGEFLHSKGFKFGIYTDRGSKTCAGRAGSLGSERLDARTFASWGVDFVKEDNCHSSDGPDHRDTLFQQFGLFRDALNATGRPMFFSVCGGGDELPYRNISYYASDPRGGARLANSWRVTADVIDSTTCCFARDVTAGLAQWSGPAAFNDPDMLLGSSPGSARRLSEAMSRTQFSLWAILMAPLLIGADLHQLSAHDLETYSNRDVIAVSQDPLLKQGQIIFSDTWRTTSVWGRALADGSWVLLFVNDSWWRTRNVTCSTSCWEKLPFNRGTRLSVRDLWGQQTMTETSAGEDFALQVAAWGASRMVKLQPVASIEMI
mmetsp:Transcript_34537/g.62619  ORF Transcript_34537/g.62619 Transcript_34537/m.62619 type:complete len:414 (-) Transcript_34537:180-1421(-)